MQNFYTHAESCDTIQGSAALSPPKSSLLVMTEMSELYQEEGHVAWPAHILVHSQTPFFFFFPNMNMYVFHTFPTNGVDLFSALMPPPQAGLAMACLWTGSAQFFTRLFICSHDGHQSQSFNFSHQLIWFLHFFASCHTSLVIYLIISILPA